MDGIEERLIEVGSKAKNVTHVFAGFPGGAMRMWPAIDWTKTDQNSSKGTCPEYDPRETSWYALASTGPLDVVVVLDMSFRMCQLESNSLSREAVRALIRMLGSGVNYLNVIMFNETSTYLLPSAQSRLVNGKPTLLEMSATTGEMLRMDLLDARPQCKKEFSDYKVTNSPMFLQAIAEAEAMLTYSREVSTKKAPSSAFCRRAIVVLSSHSAPEVNITLNQNSGSGSESDSGVNVFAFTYGGDETVQMHHKQLTCNNSGLHSIMRENATSHVNEIFKITQFFGAGMLESHSIWTMPLVEDFMLRNTYVVARSCRWLVSSPPKLLAVVGVAVPIHHVTGALTEEEREELMDERTNCPAFELEEYGIEELRGDDRCESAIDLVLVLVSIIIGFFVIVLTSTFVLNFFFCYTYIFSLFFFLFHRVITFTMLPQKTVDKILPCFAKKEKNSLGV